MKMYKSNCSCQEQRALTRDDDDNDARWGEMKLLLQNSWKKSLWMKKTETQIDGRKLYYENGSGAKDANAIEGCTNGLRKSLLIKKETDCS